MASIFRQGDTYYIRSKLPANKIRLVDGFDAWCYLHRVKIAVATEAPFGGTDITFDVGVAFDSTLAYLFKAICEIEIMEAKNGN